MSKKAEINNKLVKKSNDILPAIFQYDMSDIPFKVPPTFQEADKGTITKILNACKSSFGDDSTVIYFDSRYIHHILRTKDYIAIEYIFELGISERINYENKIYISLPAVMKLITERMNSLGAGRTRDYLAFAESCLINIRDNDKFINIRTKLEKNWESELNKLKKQRIKQYNIKNDELTGEKLRKNHQFSHIRSKAIYMNNALDINNGLIVNAETHNIITSKKVINENGLIELCKEQNWETNWYNIFKNLVE